MTGKPKWHEDEIINKLGITKKQKHKYSSPIINKIAIILEGYICQRCLHKWLPRLKELPVVCPKCHSPYWNRKRLIEC